MKNQQKGLMLDEMSLADLITLRNYIANYDYDEPLLEAVMVVIRKKMKELKGNTFE